MALRHLDPSADHHGGCNPDRRHRPGRRLDPSQAGTRGHQPLMGQLWTILISVTAAFILVWVILLIALIVSRPADLNATEALRSAARRSRRDLLDANESTWAFVVIGSVGRNVRLHVTRLATLARRDGCRSYCGRTADRKASSGEREDAGGSRRSQVSQRGQPPPPWRSRCCG